MRWLSLILGLVLCCAGGIFAAIESFKQPSYAINEQLNAGHTVGKTYLLQEIEQQKELAAWGWKDADLLKSVALTEYALANNNLSDASVALLHTASDHLSEGLALSPVDSIGWLRLAHLRVLTKASPEDIGQALHMSLITGPTITPLIASRLRIALVYWDYLKEDDRTLFMTQIRLLKQWKPQEAATLADMNERNQQLFSIPTY